MGISYHSCPPETVTHYILYNIIFSPRLSSHLLTTLLSASIFIMTSPSQKILPPTTFQSHVTVSIVVPLTKLIRRYADSEGTVVSSRLALFFLSSYLRLIVGGYRCLLSHFVCPSLSSTPIPYPKLNHCWFGLSGHTVSLFAECAHRVNPYFIIGRHVSRLQLLGHVLVCASPIWREG